jgi:ribosomal-protein-alanine N-acetyltransferase
MPPARLRPLVRADLDLVAEIERETFADAWSRRSFAGMLNQPHIHAIAAEDASGSLIGYGMCSIAADEGEILNIAVTRGARRQGAGGLLLQALLGHLRRSGARQAYLEVRRSNVAAIGLYKAAGFLPLGVRPAYYAQPREDALTMSLELGSQTARK